MFEGTDSSILYKALNYLQAIPGKIFFMDEQGRYVMMSKDSQLIDYHYIGESILGKTNLEVMPDKKFAKQTYESDMRVIRTGEPVKFIKKTEINGEIYYSEIIKQPVWNNEHTKIIGLAGIVNDITEIQKAKFKLEEYTLKMKELIVRDKLTQAYNRYYIQQWVDLKEKKLYCDDNLADKVLITEHIIVSEKADKKASDDSIIKSDAADGKINKGRKYINKINRIKYPLTAVVADCNELKSVNDQLGHYAGDEFISAMTAMLGRATNRKHPVVRLGGDEFLIICEDTSEQQAEELITKIKKLSQTYIIHGFQLSASYGYATTHDNSKKLEEIISEADNKMYIEKNKYKKDELKHEKKVS